MKAITILATVAAFAVLPATAAEHITLEDLALYQMQHQNPQKFVTEFKTLTGLQLSDEIMKRMKLFAVATSVAITLAVVRDTPTLAHDLRHCVDQTCFEQWVWRDLPNTSSLGPGAQFSKIVVTDMSGKIEGTTFCHALIGVSSCTVEVENGRRLKSFFEFTLKDAQRGVVGRLFDVN